MAAILAKKLGMTPALPRGWRVARVTVLEAGPCPVTAIRTHERDGYDAVQLAFGPCKEKRSRKPELGHLAKADAPPIATLVEFRDDGRRLRRRDRDRRRVRARRAREDRPASSKGKGFQGTIKRHGFSRGPKSHGSHNYRAPGSIGASATPVARDEGHPRPRPMGSKRVTQKGLEIVALTPRAT